MLKIELATMSGIELEIELELENAIVRKCK
jgi:hypothetical protein